MIIGLGLYTITYIIAFYFLNYKATILEHIGVLTSYICTILVVQQKKENFYFAIISTICFSILFFKEHLYGSMLTNMYFIGISIYGIYSWNKIQKVQTITSIKTVLYYAIFSIISYIVCVIGFRLLGGKFVLLDTSILFISIVANILMVHKKVEHWYLWILVNIISIYVYFSNGLYYLGIQFTYFLINAFIGIYMWRKK